ncbi:hypothetical protein CCU68_05625 [Pseudomonas gingeri NCPPB 3146 = LMG 5327]|uniref:Uncharacterized protein n=1 Tax=Pseudomonas gingeri NCPPB 3146 = LMG 5327 TaxID=707248 RepID=A0ABX4Y925_9PSED|nr:hypothetical protein CCU68_05625 [Pseudomonas gingeri NCPPB 3146 = LMG 5327]
MHCSCDRNRWQARSHRIGAHHGLSSSLGPCRSRLAGDEALEPCIALAAAIAGKPAPTMSWIDLKVR